MVGNRLGALNSGTSQQTQNTQLHPEAEQPTSAQSKVQRVPLCGGTFGLFTDNLDSGQQSLVTQLDGKAKNSLVGTAGSAHQRHASDPFPTVGSPPLGKGLGLLNTSVPEPFEQTHNPNLSSKGLPASGLRTPGGSVITPEEFREVSAQTQKIVDAYEPSKEDEATQATAQTLLEKAKSLNSSPQRIALEVQDINVNDYFNDKSKNETSINAEKVTLLAKDIAEKIKQNGENILSPNLQRLVLVTSNGQNSGKSMSLALLADRNQKFQVALKETLESFGIILGGIKVTAEELESEELFQSLNDSVANQDMILDHQPLVHLIAPNLIFEPKLPTKIVREKLLRIFEPRYEPEKSTELNMEEILSVQPERITNNRTKSMFEIRKVLTQRAQKFSENLWVVKFGSLQLEPDNMKKLMEACSRLRKNGIDVVVVASGAVMYGDKIKDMHPAQLANLSRPSLAAIGQPWLDQLLTTCSAQKGMSAVQLLLSPWQLADEDQRKKVATTVWSLLKEGKVPVINGNDVTGKPGSNDGVAVLIQNLLGGTTILTTNQPGMYNNFGTPEQQLIKDISYDEAVRLGCASSSTSSAGTGGFKTKLIAAGLNSGKATYIVEGGTNFDKMTRMEALILAVTAQRKGETLNLGGENKGLSPSDLLEKIPHTAIHTDPSIPLTYFSEKI